ncbi:MAG TPA: O-antigen ligase family protein [Polyangia bacterium]|jgi:O-antigen ligase|nr:O-antigen ligase family protein [Polyangia bacterium]
MSGATGATGAVGPAALVAAVVAVPLFYVRGADSPFADPKLALVLIAGGVGLAAGLVAWVEAQARGGGRAGGSAPVRAALAAVVATTILAAAIAAVRRPTGAPYALAEIVRWLALIGVAAAAAQAARDPLWRRRLFEAIHVAAGLVAAIGLLQHLELLPFSLPVISVPGSTFGNRNMAGEAVALALPFGFATVGQFRWGGRLRSGWAVAALLAQLAFLAVTRARGAWLGGALGIVVFFAVRRPVLARPARLAIVPVAAIVLAAALLPGRWRPRDANDTKRYESGGRVVMEAIDPASPVARTRLGLWRRTLAMYREHPLSGVGPGNFGVLFPLHAEPGAAADRVMSAVMVPRRPHNELLERLAETGPLGLVSFGALFVTAIGSAFATARVPRERDQPAPEENAANAIADVDAAAAAAGAVAACFGCGLTAFPLAMPATVLLFGVALGVLDAVAPATDATTATATIAGGTSPRRAGVAAVAGLAIAVVLGAGWLSYGLLASSYWRGRARAALAPAGGGPGDPTTALAHLERAGRAPRVDPGRFDIALRTAQVALRIDMGGPALAAADRALAIEPYSPHAWAARAAAELALRDEAQAANDAAHALKLFLDLPSAQTTLATIRKLQAVRADGQVQEQVHEEVGR